MMGDLAQRIRNASLVVILIGILLLVIACTSSSTGTSEAPTADSPPGNEPAAETSIAGRYRLKAPDYEEDYDQALTEDYYLVLNEDGTAQFEAVKITDAADPGDDLFTETTRKAVVAFQESQGLLPNGEVNPATWVLLGNPQQPVPTPTPLPPLAEGEPRPGVPDIDNLPTHTDDGQPILYLTFDDGPSSFSQQMIDLMAKHDAQATFFVLGQAAGSKPDLVRAVAQAGHYVANHTYSHPSLEGVSQEGFLREVEETREIILDIALDLFTLDRDVRYLRPPHGATDADSRQYAADAGYAIVLWDIDPQDWRRPRAKVIADHVVREAYPGAIVLMHDGGGDRAQSVAALETILSRLSQQGYAFANVYVP